jgi:Predicted site-specific integrase-resolvase
MKNTEKTNDDFLIQKGELDKEFKKKIQDFVYDGEFPTLTAAEEVEFYRNRALRNKDDILQKVEYIKKYFKVKAKERKIPIERLIPLLEQFKEEMYTIRLMDITQDWWQYCISVRETDVALKLEHTKIYYDHPDNIEHSDCMQKENVPYLASDQSFTIYTTRAKLLSPEEYGKLHGVSDGTVRQWIRRGKIRSAAKYGKEWRIPELARISAGHYMSASYSWNEELPDVPEEFAYLNMYNHVEIFSVKGEKDKWRASFDDWKHIKEDRDEYFDSKVKERLELYLMAEPLVECENNYFGEFRDKERPVYEHD